MKGKPYIRLTDIPHAAKFAAKQEDSAPQRELAPSEKEEILANGRSLWRKPLVQTSTTLMMLCISLMQRNNTDPNSRILSNFVLIFAIPVIVMELCLIVRGLKRERLLKQDNDGGIVLQLPGSNLHDSVEYLPHSGIIWTEGGTPGYWRGHPET